MEYTASVIAFALIYAICVMAENLNLGYSGQFTIAQGAIFGIGAYTYALGTNHGLAIPTVMLLAVLIAAAVGAFLAFIGRGLRGDYFLIVTFAFQVIAVQMAHNFEFLGGGTGLFGVRPLSLFGFEPRGYVDFVQLFVPIVIVVWLFYTLLTATRLGLIWKAIREDDGATLSLGRSTTLYKMLAFAFAAAGTGFAGTLYAGFITFVDPTQFTFAFSILIVSMLIVGGIGNPLGPLFGAAVITGLPEALRFLPHLPDETRARLLQMIYGLALLLVVAFRPQGLVPERPGRWSIASWRWRLRGRRHPALATVEER